MKPLILLLCIIGALIDTSLSAPNLQSRVVEVNYRLNRDVEPIDYLLELTPYLTKTGDKEQFTYDGKVTIKLKPTEPGVKVITLHKQDLNVKLVGVSDTLKSGSISDHDSYDPQTNKYSVILKEPLIERRVYELELVFSGKLRTDMTGFYRSSYRDGNETRWLASTKMEPTHARRAFPCFDEPHFKATFSLILNRPKHFTESLANTPIKKNEIGSDFVREIFEKSPKMSTYLVAWVISDFNCRENSNKTFGVCSRPNALDQTEYSFSVGEKTLAIFNALLTVPYSLHMKKLHMIAIPDFAAGAMENWGLVTYRETALLYDPNVSTAMAKQRVGTVVAHEETHMWFGNLVTCDWWSNLWLNEGFASYFEYFATAVVEDSWGLDEQFTVHELQHVFHVDSLEDTHALTHEVNSPKEISDRFDSISYDKGASVIRMVEHVLGKERFYEALQLYIKSNSLSTVVPEKLYEAFQSVVRNELSIAKLLGGWVVEPGYPVLTVTVSKDRKTAEISQRRFLLNKDDHTDKTQWQVPITFASPTRNSKFTETEPIDILSEESIEIDLGEANDWIIVNVQQTGYYRVNYDKATWTEIRKVLINSPTIINVLNRAQIVDDSLNLARGHLLSYPEAFETVRYMKHEYEYAPWKATIRNLDFIMDRSNDKEDKLFKSFTINLVENVYKFLGFYPRNTDRHLDILTRNILLKFACQNGHLLCIDDARAEFGKLLSNKKHKIPNNLVPVVYNSVIKEGSQTEWEYLWKRFQTENVAGEKLNILNALGHTQQANLTKKYLDLILSNEIRLQDKHSALVSTLSLQVNIDLVLDFIIENNERITKVFESDRELLKILTVAADRSTTRGQVEKISKFVDDQNLNDKKLQAAVKNAQHNLNWAKHNLPILRQYFLRTGTGGSATTTAMSYLVVLGAIIVSYISY